MNHSNKINDLIVIIIMLLSLSSGCAAPDETRADGDAVDGDAADGDTVDGDAADGDTVDGDAADGDTVDGDAADGDTVDEDQADSDPDFNTESDDGEFVSDHGLTWIFIPGGSYPMGCSAGDESCEPAEKPRHEVNVPGFWMARTETTQAQYFQTMGDNPSAFQPPEHGECLNCPVEQVDWQRANAFCVAVEGRLPSEAEWEYAARSGATTRFSCGDDEDCLDDIAWSYGESSGPNPTGQKKPNAFGLFDMLGNVREWTADCLHDNYQGAPTDGGVWVDELGCHSARVARGGSWEENGSYYLRVSFRIGIAPDQRSDILGFRCARDAD